MKSGSSFLLAARQCEIAELEQLARTSELVGVIARFIHALQRERGISGIFLSSRAGRCSQLRTAQAEECDRIALEVRAQFERLDTEPAEVRNGARLFSRVALVLHGMDSLAALRERIATLACPAEEAAASYSRLIAGLLGVVFEAADAATDPQVSRTLVALFNFMQGKEFAGQERALGARLFAGGATDAAGAQQWRHLVEAQQGCFNTHAAFCDAELLRAELALRDPLVQAELERLRRIGCMPAAAPLDPALSQPWYDCCTRRIDAMKQVEDRMALHLKHLCERRIVQARAELHDQRKLLEELAREDVPAQPAYGPRLERSVLTLVQEQAQRLQAMGDELESVRNALHERKVVERAKGLLMAHRQMGEDEAYKAMRQMAMNQNRRIVDVAQAVLSLAEVLPGSVR